MRQLFISPWGGGFLQEQTSALSPCFIFVLMKKREGQLLTVPLGLVVCGPMTMAAGHRDASSWDSCSDLAEEIGNYFDTNL